MVSCTHSCDSLEQQEAKQDQQREGTWGEVRGTAGAREIVLESMQSESSPREPHRTHLLPPAMSYDNTQKTLPTKEAR